MTDAGSALRWKVAVGFIGAMLLTSSLDFLSWRNKEAASNDADSVAHSYAVMRALDLTLADIIDMETGARGFAATGKDQFLEPYNDGQASLRGDLSTLRKLTSGSSYQQQWLGPLTDDIKASMTLSGKIVFTRRHSDDVPSVSEFQKGKDLVDAVRTAIRAEENEQTQMLNQRFANTVATRKKTDLAMLVTTGIELSLLGLAWMAVARALTVSARARMEVENSNSELERRVAERTAQLSTQAQLLVSSGEALRSESRMLQSVLDNMEEGLTAADRWGRFTLWNRAAEKILGLPAQIDLPMERWSEVYGCYLPDGETRYPSSEIPLVRAMRGESSDGEMFIRNSQREQGVWLEISARPLKDENGTIHGALATFRDISRRKRDETEIRILNDELEQRVVQRTVQLEAANKELESFTYSVSHDLRAPLRHISGFSKILAEEFASSLPPDAQRYLDRINQGTRKMGILVDELLALAGIGRHPLNPRPTELNPLIDDVVNMLAPETQGRLVEWKIEELGSVNCDPVLLRQVFQNLIANAIKFTRPRTIAIVEIGRVSDMTHPTFFIRDNGVGFDMKYSDKLFGVFQRLHRSEDFDGTGIGLATVQRIIQKHGGRAWAEAELGKGATFYFSLALEEQVEPAAMGATAGAQI